MSNNCEALFFQSGNTIQMWYWAVLLKIEALLGGFMGMIKLYYTPQSSKIPPEDVNRFAIKHVLL